MKVEIRAAKPEELSQILEIQQASLRQLCINDYDARQIEALVDDQQQIRGKDELAIVAYHQETMVGFATLWMGNCIGAVYVEPTYARQGIGAQLLAALETAAIEQRYKTLWVTASLNAVGFYAANGYRKLRTTGFWTRSRVWVPCVAMEKRIMPMTVADQQRKTTKLAIFLILLVVSLLLVLLAKR